MADDLYHNPRRARWEAEIDGGAVERGAEHRLFVGNLDKRVNEYVILKLFSKHGKIVREQFMWHHDGPRRGEPRGFCFVEYATGQEAMKAKQVLDGMYLFGRPLRVRFSEEKVAIGTSAETEESEETKEGSGPKENFTCGADDEYSLDAKMAALRRRLAGYQQQDPPSKRQKTSATTLSEASAEPEPPTSSLGRGRGVVKPAWKEKEEREQKLRDALAKREPVPAPQTDLEKLTSEDS